MSPRILVFDLENSPATGEFWGKTFQTSIIRVTKPSSVISFAAKWVGERNVEFRSDFHDGHDVMVQRARDLLDEADAVVSYNGARHDTPHINTEIKLAGLTPPSPYIEIDLYRVVRRKFKFQQNRLAFVADELFGQSKVAHEGYGLWVKCADGDAAAWAKMRRYNIGDVKLTERLYHEVQEWIPQSMHPNLALYVGDDNACPKCGVTGRLQRRGTQATSVARYPRLQCQACGGWSRGKRAVDSIGTRGAA